MGPRPIDSNAILVFNLEEYMKESDAKDSNGQNSNINNYKSTSLRTMLAVG